MLLQPKMNDESKDGKKKKSQREVRLHILSIHTIKIYLDIHMCSCS